MTGSAGDQASNGIRSPRSSAGRRSLNVLEEDEDYFDIHSDTPCDSDGSDDEDVMPRLGADRRVSTIKERLQGLNSAPKASSRRISLHAGVHAMTAMLPNHKKGKGQKTVADGAPPMRQSLFSMGNRLSVVPVGQNALTPKQVHLNTPKQDGPPPESGDRRFKKRGTMNPYARNGSGKVTISDFMNDEDGDDENSTKGIRRRSNDHRPRKRHTFKSNFVRFEPTGAAEGLRAEAAFTGRYVDELAMERSQRDYRHKLAAKNNAILHHRDSMLIGSNALGNSAFPDLSMLQKPIAELGGSTGLSATPRKERTKELTPIAPTLPKVQGQWTPVQTFRRLPLFASCSDHFLNVLAAGSEQMTLKTGEVRDIGSVRSVGLKANPSMAVVVESGVCRIEVGHTVVSECGPGSSFGLANVLVGVAPMSSRAAARPAPVGPAADFLVRATHETCRCISFPCTALRRALSECPNRSHCLREMLRMVNHQLDGTQHLAAYLNCCDSAKPAITDSSTREVYAKGEKVVVEGDKTPDALLFIRSGTAALEIRGVEVRRIHKGQVVGEEMLFGVCRKWAFTVECLTACDVQLLHRHLFIAAVFKMQEGNTEDKRESQRLLTLIDGTWKDDKVHLAWPLFRGYEGDLLAKLASVIETRVLLPGSKLWENVPNWYETALYFLLSGGIEEVHTTERQVRKDVGQTQRAMQQADSKCTKRTLAPGACLGAREFLGLASTGHVVVKAHCLCLVAVLHRSVYLHILDGQEAKSFQSSEVTRLLEEDLDRQDDSSAKGEVLLNSLSLFKGHDKAFIEKICDGVAIRRFCIRDQYLCHSSIGTDSMFVPIRGDVRMQIAGIEIKQCKCGKEINAIALANNAFMPSFTVVCEKTSELWAVSRSDFMACLKSFPSDRRRVEELLTLPSSMPDLFVHSSSLVNMEQLDGMLGDDVKGSAASHRAGPMSPGRRMSLHNRRFSNEGNTHGLAPSAPDSSRCITPGSPSSNTSIVLCHVDIFKACSQAFLLWLEEHLEAAVWFPDEPVVKEGELESSLYVLRAGTVVVEGAGAGGAQESLSAGASFGEYRLLGLSQQVKATTIAIEISVLQVLHRSVFQRGLELFPDQRPHFDRVTLHKLEASQTFELSNSPFFYGCNRDFRVQIDRLMVTRLVHPGALIVEEGEDGKKLRILKSGSAIVEDEGREPQKHLQPGAVLNADLVLGVTRCAVASIRAEKLCAVAEVESLDFLGLLQRFPQEIMPLLQVAVGTLFPPEADAVPLFRGVNSYFFAQLMETSEWHMFLPDHCVVRQGGAGQMMFLLCYGVAVRKVDGCVVGSPLLRGECIGKANLFGLSGKYSSSVFTQTVCHFRTILSSNLARLLKDHAAEHERFESLKQQVQAELAEHQQEILAEVTREKLRRRADLAFRGHVSRERDANGLAPSDSLASLQSLKMQDVAGGTQKASREKSRNQHGSDDEKDSGASSDEGNDQDPWSKKKSKKDRGKTLDGSKNVTNLAELADGLNPKRINALVEKIKQHREHEDEESHVDQIWSEDGGQNESLAGKRSSWLWKENKAGSDGSEQEDSAAPDLEDTDPKASKGQRQGNSNNRQTLATKKGNKRRKRGQSAGNRAGKPLSPVKFADPSPRQSSAKQQKDDDGGEHWNGDDDSDSSSDDAKSMRPKGFGVSKGQSSDSSIVKVMITDVDSHSRRATDAEKYDSSDSFEKVFFTRLQEMGEGRPMSKLQLIDAAIAEHAGARQRAIQRGKVLRLLHNGLPLDGVPRGAHQLSQEDLHELSFHLPHLPAAPGTPGAPSAGDEETTTAPLPIATPRKQQRDVLLCDGAPPMRSLPPAHQKAMRKKYMQLTGQ